MTQKFAANRLDFVTYVDGHGNKQAIIEARAIRVNVSQEQRDPEPDVVLFVTEALLVEFIELVTNHLKQRQSNIIMPPKKGIVQ